jgi:hypothetical protein
MQRGLADPQSARAREVWQLAERERDLVESENGWRLYGSTSYGMINEIDGDELRYYEGLTYEVGLSHPLLASHRAQKRRHLEARLNAALEEGQWRATLADSRTRLARLYIDYWHAFMQVHLAESMLMSAEGVEAVLNARTEAGYLLLSDRWVLLNGLQDARRNLEHFSARMDLRLEAMRRMTKSGLPAFWPVMPALPKGIEQSHAWQAALDRHPALVPWRERAKRYFDDSCRCWADVIEGSFRVGYNESHEFKSEADDNGSGLVASVNLSVPLEATQFLARTRSTEATRAALANTDFRQQLALMQDELDRLLDAYVERAGYLQLFEQRRQSAARALEERSLRAEALPGDVLEALVKARIDYYASSFALVNVIADLWRTRVELDALAVSGHPVMTAERLNLPNIYHLQAPLKTMLKPFEQPLKAGAEERHMPPPAASFQRGVYVWNSAALMDPDRGRSMLGLFERLGIDQVMVSLDAQQIRDLDRISPDIQRLQKALAARRMQMGLLLGDANWILPENQSRLTALVERLSGLPFSALHLDIELEQLPDWESRQDFYIEQWVSLTEQVQGRSPWPLSFSLHPRWLDKSRGCIACRLKAAGASGLSVMIYTPDPDKSITRLESVQANTAGLPVTLALSVEQHLPEIALLATDLDSLSGQLDRAEVMLQRKGVKGLWLQDADSLMKYGDVSQ